MNTKTKKVKASHTPGPIAATVATVRLRDAAPDLLAALKAFTALPDSYFGTQKARICYHAAIAAIAKAEGGAA